MSARTTRSLLLLSTLLLPSLSYASVSISEVFYSPQSKSWIEVYNDGDTAVDLSKYKILDSSVTTGHGVSAVSGANPLPRKSYAVVAVDPTAFVSPAFTLYKSALKAKVAGDTFSLKDEGGNIIDTFSFTNSMGAAGDGNSLQKTSTGGWISAVPTPGVINATTASTPVTTQPATDATSSTTRDQIVYNTGDVGAVQQTVVTTVSTHYSYLPLSYFDTVQSLAVSAGRARLAAIGNPVEFVAEANQDDGAVAYQWNFGDGVTDSGKIVRHIYNYPGQYVVVLSASSQGVQAVSRTTVKVVNPDIFVVDANPQFVKVHNDSTDEINLYGWELRSGITTYMFPKDTIILPGQSLMFGSSITHLLPATVRDVTLAESVVPGASPTIARSVSEPERQMLLARESGVVVAVKPVVAKRSRSAQAKQVLPVKTISVAIQVAAPELALATTTGATSSLPVKKSSWLTTVRRFFGLP